MPINNSRCRAQHQKQPVDLLTLEESWFEFNSPLIFRLSSSNCKKTMPVQQQYLPSRLKSHASYIKFKSGAICLQNCKWICQHYQCIIWNTGQMLVWWSHSAELSHILIKRVQISVQIRSVYLQYRKTAKFQMWHHKETTYNWWSMWSTLSTVHT